MNWKSVSFNFINLAVGIWAFLSCSFVANDTNQLSSQDQLVKKDSLILPSIVKEEANLPTITGAEQTETYIPLLEGKKVGVVANNTSLIGNVHLVDSLLRAGIDVKIVFSPEHGFRGDHDAGAKVKHSVDERTGLPIYSLHGKTKKPSEKSLKDVDVLLFDIQDVGVRFYTYISTLHYVMEACAENNTQLILLDRPNPNAHYVAGPVLENKYKSFVGMHPVPVVYGMSIGEYAQMINGESWLKDSLNCTLKVVPLKNWNHDKEYILPVPPSPNLATQLSIYLYPHLCLFEGTSVSVGRGTKKPFEKYGHPKYNDTTFSFMPKAVKGKSLNPPFKNKVCNGKDLSAIDLDEARKIKEFKLSYIIDAMNKTKGVDFFAHKSFFNLLAGNGDLIKQLLSGVKENEIQNSWEIELLKFKKKREQYLLYP